MRRSTSFQAPGISINMSGTPGATGYVKGTTSSGSITATLPGPTPTSPTDSQARDALQDIATDSGSGTLKLQLADEGISLTDNSDVGPGKRFETYVEKLGYVMRKKLALIVAMRLSMIGGSWGPTMTDDIQAARDGMYGRAEGNGNGNGPPPNNAAAADGRGLDNDNPAANSQALGEDAA